MSFQFYQPKKNSKYIYEGTNQGLEKDHGNVDTPTQTFNVRTWSYVANKKIGWKLRLLGSTTKNIEDKLSDKLHDELTKSFIDKNWYPKKFKTDLVLNTEINNQNKVFIDEQLIGELRVSNFL